METNRVSLTSLCARTAVVHTVTYFIMGVLASSLLDYRAVFASPTMVCWMRQFGDPMINAGVLFQPLRGILFGLAFYPFREVIFEKKHGWLFLSWLLVAIGILGTFGPAPGSLEGMIFTRIPAQYMGWLEVVPQAVLLSGALVYWVKHPEKKWLTWVLLVLLFLAVAGSVSALLVQK